MEWATVLFSGVVAGAVSALVSWIGGLHRDKRAAEQQAAAAALSTAHRREDIRRDRLSGAIVDFLTADRQRFDEGWKIHLLVTDKANADLDESEWDTRLSPLIAKFSAPNDAAVHAAQRVGLYAPGLYGLTQRVRSVNKVRRGAESTEEARANRNADYQAQVDAFVAAARVELGVAPPFVPGGGG